MIKLKKNLLAGILTCLIGVAYRFLISVGIKAKVQFTTKAIGPDYMPKLVSYVLIVLGAILIYQSVVLKKDEYLIIAFNQEKPVLLYLVVLLGLIILTPLIGFLPASTIAAVLFMVIMGEKKILYYVIVLIMCAAIYALFRFILGVPVP